MSNNRYNLRPRQKHSSHGNDVINATKEEEKTLTNICYDCLERIFDFLDLESLLNVAGTCKRLQIAAVSKFGYVHKGKIITFDSNPRPWLPNLVEGITMKQNQIKVCGWKFYFPFLRCFGAKLFKLRVNYENVVTGTRSDHLDRYINQYCADTLTTIRFQYKQNFRMENFPKPFKNIISVSIIGNIRRNDVPTKLNLFVHWFPNVCQLILDSIFIEDATNAVHFPHLDQLWVRIVVGNKRNLISMKNVTKILRANQQLRCFEIIAFRKEITINKLLNMTSKNPFILKLGIMGRNSNVNAVELNRFIAKHPLIQMLDLNGYCFKADDAIMFIRQLKSLIKFTFRMKEQSECDRLVEQLDDKWKKDIRHSYDITIDLSC